MPGTLATSQPRPRSERRSKAFAMPSGPGLPLTGVDRSRRKRPALCKRCGNPPPDGEVISWRGHCIDCAVAVMVQHNNALAARTGPEYEAQQRAAEAGMRRYAERFVSG